MSRCSVSHSVSFADLFKKEKYSDAKVCVNSLVVPAHAIILSKASSLWEEQLKHGSEITLNINENHVDTFMKLLELIYGGTVDFELAQVLPACQLVHKYKLSLPVLDAACKLSHNDFHGAVIQHTFQDFPPELFVSLFSRDDLPMNESAVVSVVQRYLHIPSHSEEEVRRIKTTIRFPSLSEREVWSDVSIKSLMTSEQYVEFLEDKLGKSALANSKCFTEKQYMRRNTDGGFATASTTVAPTQIHSPPVEEFRNYVYTGKERVRRREYDDIDQNIEEREELEEEESDGSPLPDLSNRRIIRSPARSGRGRRPRSKKQGDASSSPNVAPSSPSYSPARSPTEPAPPSLATFVPSGEPVSAYKFSQPDSFKFNNAKTPVFGGSNPFDIQKKEELTIKEDDDEDEEGIIVKENEDGSVTVDDSVDDSLFHEYFFDFVTQQSDVKYGEPITPVSAKAQPVTFDFDFEEVPPSLKPNDELAENGEKDETLLNESIIKLFEFDSENGKWEERGIGTLRVLQRSSTVRLVVRSEHSLLVWVNCAVFSGMKNEKQGQRFIRVGALDQKGHSTPLLFKFQELEQLSQVLSLLNKHSV